MVYKSGGSKGCGTCRQRKVLCDLNTPECQRCFTTGRKCSGYDLPRNFKVFNPEKAGRQRARIPVRILPRVAGTRADEEFSAGSSQEIVRSSTVPRSPSPRPEYREKFAGLFRDLFMPSNCASENLTRLQGGWMNLLPNFHGRYKLLDDSLLALCTGYVGRRKNDSQLKYLGTKLYGESLQKLRRKQSKSSENHFENAEALLATIMVFSRCELVSTADGDGHAIHILGGLRLLKNSMHALPETAFSKLLIRKFRCLGFYISIRHRQAFFMAEPPYTLAAPARKDNPDYLFQACLENIISLPAVMEEADKLDQLMDLTPEIAQRAQETSRDLLQQASVLDHKFASWFTEMKRHAAPPTPLLPTVGPRNVGIRFSPTRLGYKSVEDGFLWTLYWAMSLYINQVIKQLQVRHDSLMFGSPSNSILLPVKLANMGKDRATLDEYADNICGSIFSDLGDSTFTAHENMVGMFTAQWYYEQRGDIEKLKWCIGVLQMMEAEGLNLGLQVQEREQHGPVMLSKCLADK